MYGQPQNPETIEGLSPTCRGAVGGIDADGCSAEARADNSRRSASHSTHTRSSAIQLSADH